jgi:zinc protease
MFNSMVLQGSRLKFSHFFKRSLFLTLSLSFLPTSVLAADPKAVVNIQHWQTNQGVPVYFVPTPEIPMLDVDVVFDAGSARDGDKPGLANLTAGMLDEGAGKLNTDQIAEAFDNVGAIYSIDVNQDMALVGFRSLTQDENLTSTLDTFKTVLTDPKFPQDSFERLQKQVLISLEQRQQSPRAIASEASVKAIYGDQPYGHITSGTRESIAKLTPKDVREFYKKYYVANNARLVMVGDLTLGVAKEIAEKIVASLPQGEAAKPIPDMQAKKQPVRENIEFPAQQTTVYMGQLGVKPDDPDYFSLLVGNQILGGGLLVSRLFEEVREKRGLVYSIGSRFLSLAARGSFIIFLQTRNEEANNAIELTQNVLKEFIEKGPDKKELEAVKKNIIGGFFIADRC